MKNLFFRFRIWWYDYNIALAEHQVKESERDICELYRKRNDLCRAHFRQK